MEQTSEMQSGQGDKTSELDLSDEQFDEIVEIICEIDDPIELCECVYSTIESLLWRETDRDLLNAFSEKVGEVIGDIPFEAPAKDRETAIRDAARASLAILRNAREMRASRQSSETAPVAEEKTASSDDDEFYYLPPNLAHLLKHVEYTSPAPLEPMQKFETFRQLYETAIINKINNTLVFFHKQCDSTFRDLPRPFILSPAFSKNLQKAIEALIFPHIDSNHQVHILTPGVDWTNIDTQTFWTNRNTQLVRRKIRQLWARAWDELKLVKTAGEDGVAIAQIKENTKLLRSLLAPTTEDEYDIPRIANREILFFESMIDTPEDWLDSMNAIWQRCQDLYEQEIDPRVFQQKAREGALRDNILLACKEFPEQWGDFLVLLCHYVFPRISTRFLEQFTASLGTTDALREQRMPYLMRYLRLARINPKIKARELKEEEAWRSQSLELRNFLTGRAESKDLLHNKRVKSVSPNGV
ncbi:hypothetical protein GALL_300120 [mine drainage metagenome]|uniref:Uncharacterized protein n=1 Tax=mine drainage metagenome TaxID=410659 RepID=A0A1J5QX25_9ZZZZ